MFRAVDIILTGRIKASFLVIEKDGHFKKHKDTEKEVGMFGTLLVELPARHYGPLSS